MAALTATPPLATDGAVPRSPALAARRWFLVASPVLAGVLAVVGAAADPAQGLDGARLYELYAANPGPLQFKSLGLHWSYAFWVVPALLLAGYVRGRGAWLANVGALLAFVGMTTLPGLLFIDFYDSAIGQVYGAEGAQAIEEAMSQMWGVPVFALPGLLGSALSLPIAAVAAWRGGVLRWWSPLAVVAGMLAFGQSGVSWWGCAITTVFFTVFAADIARGTRR